ncbi:dihydroorotase [Candidatus Woesearchaeota archaeon]|nr:dihydroorotase [Candidatus Woesearchaeota archaeon]
MILIRNCRVLVENKSCKKSIVIGDSGRIEKVVSPSSVKSADMVVDAGGCFAIPGAIDVHVHCREPGMTHKEDFNSAGKAAAAGGITTILDMPNTSPATTTVKLLEEKRLAAAGKCLANYGLYLGATPDNAGEIMAATNIAGVKVYMGSSTGNLLVTGDKELGGIFSSGKRIAVHAENEAMIRENADKFRDLNDVSVHGRIRNNLSAAVEVERAINLARKNNAILHICHLSTSEETRILKNSRSKSISCEVTPHHLFLTAEKAEELGNYSKVNPPLRKKADVVSLWEGLSSGIIDMIATDHAPHLRKEKDLPFFDAPSGVPGLETMLPLMLDAVGKGRISLQQLVALTSGNPADIFKMRGRGHILPGFYADIVIVDLKKEKTIKNDDLFTKCGWSPFDGWKLRGSVEATIVNGNIVFKEGGIHDGVNGQEVVFE